MTQQFNRIVSLVPSTTETLFAIGAGDKVVGVTSFCVHPNEKVKTITKVGGTKTLKISKIIELKPDLVIANIEENVRVEIEELQKANLNVHITHPITCEDSVNHIRELGILTGKSLTAEKIATEQEALLNETRASIKKRISVLYIIWKNPYMTISKDTYIHSLIDASGGVNLTATSISRYPEITMEQIEELNPEVILLPSEPYDFKEDDRIQFLQNKNLQASVNNRIHLINGEDTCWFGSRMGSGLRLLSKMLIFK